MRKWFAVSVFVLAITGAAVSEPIKVANTSTYMPTNYVQPVYPEEALKSGINGAVVVELTVDAEGNVVADQTKVSLSEPQGVFDEAAKTAAAKFKFVPKTVDGKPAIVTGVKYRFEFHSDK